MRLVVALFALSLSLTSQVRAEQNAVEAAPRSIKPPELITFVQAPYPEAEMAEPRSAEVVLSLAVAADGSVSEASVVTSGGEAFDAAALAAARQFVFTPAEVEGKPTAVRLSYRYV